jgi:aspartate-semialdehyde dehydrogenase
MSKKYNIAVVGARGAVGQEMIRLLEARNFPVAELRLFGSQRSKGKKVCFQGQEIDIRELSFNQEEFKDIDFVLSSPGASISKKFVPFALEVGVSAIIDNTSAFRMDPKVPLVIPEINAKDIKKHKGIIANPNCSAIIMLMAVAPLYRKSKIRRIVCATYQAVSGAGANAMVELYRQSEELVDRVRNNSTYSNDLLSAIQTEMRKLKSDPLKKEVFPHQTAFNLFSHNSSIEENGYNGEELKMIAESRKILHDDKIRIVTTCIRVPVFRAHSEAVYVEFEKKMTPEAARKILAKADGIQVVDDWKNNHFPMPLEASEEYKVSVGRIREDLSSKNGLALFVAGDQLWKGAALNAVQIAETLVGSK